MTDFDFTDQTEQEAVEQTAPIKKGFNQKEWYARNREILKERRRKAYAENRNGIRDKDAASKRANRERNREAQRAHLENNREKINARRREYYKKNAEKMKPGFHQRYHSDKDAHTDKRLKRKFGITLDEYNAMFSLQGGVCAVCGTEPNIKDKNGNIRRLAVDHDHKTGRVRQLLCNACNTSIGLVKENISTLVGMIDYIKKHETGAMKNITIEFTLDEVQALAGLIDAGIKATGIQSVKAAAVLIAKLEAAVAAANKPKEVE
jgi:hypothetical protein